MSKVALVTGSGSGIGRAIALAFVRGGYTVVVNDISPQGGDAVCAEIKAIGGQSLFIQADVADVSQVQDMFGLVMRELGGVDVLVNNAGVPGAFSLIVDMPDETWFKTISVHLTGTFSCMREAARLMMTAGGGRIINIASIAGLLGTVGSGEYAAAKAGVIALTKTAAKELAAYNITVNAIAPGMVGTPTNLSFKEKGSPFITKSEGSTPTGRMVKPEEVAELIFFLSSPAAASINGEVIRIDGGAAVNIEMDGFLRDFLSKRSPTVKGLPVG